MGDGSPTNGRRLTTVPADYVAPDSDGVLLVALSGGGTRAAAFAWGVLRGLDALRVGGRSLYDRVVVLSAVSGGAFTAAWAGLHGLDSEFERRFLFKDIERSYIWEGLRRPWLMWRRRSDLAIRVHHSQTFGGARFSDLLHGHRERGPYVALHATDMAYWRRVSFTPGGLAEFGLDLGDLPVAVGTCASSAFPLVLTPVGLPAPTCSAVPVWLEEAARTTNRIDNPERWRRAEMLLDYRRHGRRIWLMDGGLADNTGVRYLLDLLLYDTLHAPLELSEPRSFRRVIPDSARLVGVVAVDASTRPGTGLTRRRHPPGLLSMAYATAVTGMDRRSDDGVSLMHMMPPWVFDPDKDRIAEILVGANDRQIPYIAADISLDQALSPEERARLHAIPTRLALHPAEVELAMNAGSRLACSNPNIQRMLELLGTSGS